MVLRNVLINVINVDKHDLSINGIRVFIKEIMVLLDESRLYNTLRISHRGFNQLFSSSCYIHGICDSNNNSNSNIFIDIITDKDLESETYVKLTASHFAPTNIHIKQVIRSIQDL